ncbi:MAG: polyprenyl synthetase family protein [Bauldia sp.]|uniref:polyprenyl synthetase family protein n=1 Tax=Bauldia sp. TaxID=2575872 RepID=UPI001D76FC04|nr:farnesyl diphosphate synthase [Bauldia sp.]MCB1496180.1 polyprenyl synthetase family protein [Bauldia sp.]
MFETRLRQAADATDTALDRLLSGETRPAEIARPPRLLDAMRYAALGPGKRIRPFLVIETARLFGHAGDAVVTVAAALECIHAYSLVHDDLPAMDDDDMRRGRPTVHIRYDEATAILAGDALLTLAFDAVAGIDAPAETRVALVMALAQAAGIGGMAGGQALDLDASEAPEIAAVETMQAMKTGALILFGVRAGALLGNAPAGPGARLDTFGRRLGLAFQIADDLIDATGNAAIAGKATAKDAERGKRTLVGLLGVAAARARLAATVEEAIAALDIFGAEADVLRDAARFIAAREA